METQELEFNELAPVQREPESTHPMAIISRAVANGVDPDQLGKLLDLQERWDKNEARKAYNIAMKACQAEMPAIVKNCENSHTRSRYANLEAIDKAIKPIIAKYGFSLSFGSGESTVPDHILLTCDCMHVGGHTERFTLNCPYDMAGAQGKSNKTPIQGMGSSTSYGKRYLKLMIFDLTIADEDDDGNGAANATLSKEQIATLRDQLAHLTAEEEARFLDVMGSETLASIPAKDYGKALDLLQRKVRQKNR